MYFGSEKKTESSILRHITAIFVPELDKYMEIYEVNEKMVDKERFIGYIGGTATVELKDRIIPFFDETQSKDITKWFEKPEEDEDFESGVAVGTEVIYGKCTFLDKNGLCALQRLANLDGVHKWEYKPLYCILFPLTIYEGALTIDDEHIDRLKTCNVNADAETSIFDACKEELLYFLGEDSYNELEQYAKEYLAEIKIGERENAGK